MSSTTYTPASTEFPELFRMGGAELKAVAGGRSKRAKAAQDEIARRKANKAVKAAQGA